MEIKKEWTPILILVGFCIVMFFAFMGSYPLIDVDETRYVRIAQEMLNSHNFLTPTINGEIFLEKPPLFFWLEDISFLIFGVSEWSARLPMALVATFGVFFAYFTGKKFVSSRFGLISALALGSSVIYIVLSHVAILDLLLSVTMMVSTYLGIMTLYSSTEKENWLLWGGFYFFSALSALSKGFPGVVVPFGIVFLAYFFSKRLKELFDLRKIGAGLILMLIVILPWHIMMYKVHGQAFINEYILKHHLARFLNSEGINRKEPWWFYIPVILVGFIPFAMTLFTGLVNEIRKIFVNFKTGFNLNFFKYFAPEMPMEKRFLSLNILAFLFIFLLFSSASTKLPTYILPAVFPLAFIVGYVFEEYLENNKFEIQIKISNIILTSIFGLAAIAAIVVPSLGLFGVTIGFEVTKKFIAMMICAFFLFGGYAGYNVYNLVKNNSQRYFFRSTVVMMAVLTLVLNLLIFNFVVDFGQRELIEYAKFAKNNELKLATFDFGHRYSAIFYYGKNIDIQEEPDYQWFTKKLDDGYVVILKNKNMMTIPSEVKFDVIQSGKKYSLARKVVK